MCPPPPGSPIWGQLPSAGKTDALPYPRLPQIVRLIAHYRRFWSALSQIIATPQVMRWIRGPGPTVPGRTSYASRPKAGKHRARPKSSSLAAKFSTRPYPAIPWRSRKSQSVSPLASWEAERALRGEGASKSAPGRRGVCAKGNGTSAPSTRCVAITESTESNGDKSTLLRHRNHISIREGLETVPSPPIIGPIAPER